MEQKDTIELLKECEAGTQMAISAIDDIAPRVEDAKFSNMLSESKKHHEKIRDEIHDILSKEGYEDKEPGLMAQSMSALKSNFKMSMNESDRTAADLIVEGCQMGIRSLHKYYNKYKSAGHAAKDACNRLLDIEEELCRKCYGYL